MSDEKQVNPAEIAKLTQEIVRILSDEDSVTRRRTIQAALTVLGEVPIASEERPSQPNRDTDDMELPGIGGFFKRDGKLKPSDTAFLCAAYHYSEYGPMAFTTEDIRKIAAEAGEVIPDRIDKTFKGAAKKGKKLFQPVGRGVFKPTASAAVFFKETWNVKPGKKTKSATKG
jgi:hypothetical protein